MSGLRKVVEKPPPSLTLRFCRVRPRRWRWASGRGSNELRAAKLRAAARAEETGIDAEAVVADASGIPTHAARRQTRAAHKATGKTREQFDQGALSPTQAEAIAEAVDANPAAEESLLDLAANASTTDLLKECERVGSR